MFASELRSGDTFVRHSQIEWAEMSKAEQKKAERATFKYSPGICVDPARTHIRVVVAGRGDKEATWCIPKVAPVVLLTVEKPKNNKAARAKRPAGKAA